MSFVGKFRGLKRKQQVVIVVFHLLTLIILPIQTNFITKGITEEQLDYKSQIDDAATEEYTLDFLDGWTQNFGEIENVIIQNDLLYLVGGDKELFIVNVSDPINPVLVGSYTNNSEALSSELGENLLFIGLKQNGFDIIDVQNKTMPIRAGHYNTTGIIKDICLVGDYSFLAKASSGIEVINIANISQPTNVISIYDGGSAEKIICNNDLLFVADGTDGLEVYNVSDLNNPQKIANFTDGSEYFDILLKDNFAFILDDNDSMKILNISDIMNIKKIAEYSINDPTNIIVKDNLTLIASDNKISILNCTEPTTISEIAIYSTTTDIISWAIEGNMLYLAEEEGIEIIEIESETTYNIIHRFGFGQINQLILSEEYLFVSMGTEGIAIVDIKEPTSIYTISNYNASGKINDISKHNDFLYLAIENIGVEILDIQNPELPIKVGEYLSEGEANEICTTEDEYLFLADGIGGLKAFDISNPEQLQLINHFTEPYYDARKIKLYDNTLFVIKDGGYVSLYDYSQIMIPDNDFSNYEKGHISGGGYIDVVARDNVVYLSTGGDLVLVDISDRNNIEQIQTFSEGSFYTLELRGDQLFARGSNSIQILDISNIYYIRRTELFVNNTYLTDIEIENNYLVVSNIARGDDILLFHLQHTSIQPTKTIWPYIIGPIGGVVIIAISIFTVMKVRQKKGKKISKENEL